MMGKLRTVGVADPETMEEPEEREVGAPFKPTLAMFHDESRRNYHHGTKFFRKLYGVVSVAGRARSVDALEHRVHQFTITTSTRMVRFVATAIIQAVASQSTLFRNYEWDALHSRVS